MRSLLLIAGIVLALLNCAVTCQYASDLGSEQKGLANALVTLAILDLLALLACAHFL